jgi:hypothetical protein
MMKRYIISLQNKSSVVHVRMQDIIILIRRDTYINAPLISKDFIMDLCVITNIKHRAIMTRYIISMQNKSCGSYTKLA